MLLLLLLSLPSLSWAQRSEPMFSAITKTVLPHDYDNNPTQLNYGVAVTDVDGDGDLEMFVAGYNGPNLVLKYDKEKKRLVNIAVDNRSSPFYALRDRQGNAIGVTACDIDGDGREEIYVLNTNNAFSGRATYSDKLFKFRNGRFEDLLNDDINEHRDGTGRYAIYIANYASGSVGPHALIEMDEAASDLSQGVIALSNVAEQAGVNKFTGGRGVVVGPIVSQSLSDVFCDNEYGPNFLFRNNGDGTFTDVAQQAGVEDPMQHGRGVALADFNRDGKTDIVYGNWNGPHRLYMQLNNRKHKFKDAEVLMNVSMSWVSRREHGDPQIEELNVGEASEPDGRGTGAVATDFDGDGRLELLVSHGESAAQPLSIYKVNLGTTNSWLRVIPRTKFGAFARGAKVVVYTKKSGPHTRIIDGGSGYLCEMEPVAHFGLGKDMATNVEVYWPDGRSSARPLEPSDINSVLEIHYPRDEEEEVTPTVEIECGHGFALNENGRCTGKLQRFIRYSFYEDECTQFPSVCPFDRPVCTNTYGSYKCRAKRRCNQGFEPNDDGSACVAQVAYFGGARSSGEPKWSGFSFWLLSISVLPLVSTHLQTGLL
ncbi:Cartilage acidic protein 1 ASPIC [Collichthys lucidus]|uniref:Cartilage acidic protein 1 ASPIC n=1 Tax=Collichthys lucidus TaxID=240159 RepID=A0A4U5VDE2_COLLU|nr:Cartilage acidic protein 1 ASPIC [Collichthys lucidus]